jgi:tetratricopeptide (TPR) repeat protein
MRDLLEHADLSRYAGQFVWLELNYDTPANREFMVKFGAQSTPTFFVIDPQGERVTAMQTGAMSLPDLQKFLERGANGVRARTETPADAALMQGDALRATKPEDAIKSYQEALRVAPANWPGRALAETSLVESLQQSGKYQQCAETAATQAALIKRDERGDMFAAMVGGGLWCLVSAESDSAKPWWGAAASGLKPLAEEALGLTATVRDHRDELYRTQMYIAMAQNDSAAAARFGNRWLAELDAIKPASDDERSALDIARVENIQVFGDPNRILPALRESECLMANNYVASLRVAQMELAGRHYDEAIAACDRGLARNPGASGRTWILRMKADALTTKGLTAEAHRALEEALKAAQEIPTNMRETTVKRISDQLNTPGKK